MRADVANYASAEKGWTPLSSAISRQSCSAIPLFCAAFSLASVARRPCLRMRSSAPGHGGSFARGEEARLARQDERIRRNALVRENRYQEFMRFAGRGLRTRSRGASWRSRVGEPARSSDDRGGWKPASRFRGLHLTTSASRCGNRRLSPCRKQAPKNLGEAVFLIAVLGNYFKRNPPGSDGAATLKSPPWLCFGSLKTKMVELALWSAGRVDLDDSLNGASPPDSLNLDKSAGGQPRPKRAKPVPRRSSGFQVERRLATPTGRGRAPEISPLRQHSTAAARRRETGCGQAKPEQAGRARPSRRRRSTPKKPLLEDGKSSRIEGLDHAARATLIGAAESKPRLPNAPVSAPRLCPPP